MNALTLNRLDRRHTMRRDEVDEVLDLAYYTGHLAGLHDLAAGLDDPLNLNAGAQHWHRSGIPRGTVTDHRRDVEGLVDSIEGTPRRRLTVRGELA